jgi:putative transposase
MLAVEVNFSIQSQWVIRVLEFLELVHGLPKMTRKDNGPEFILRLLDQSYWQKHVKLVIIRPRKSIQNDNEKSCNGSVQKELINAMYYILCIR